MKDVLPFKAPTIYQCKTYPSTGSASANLFETRKDWPIPSLPSPTVKTEAPPQVAAIPCAMGMSKQVAEKCSWGLHCPICKNEEEHKEDWDGNRQKVQPRMYPQNTQHPQSQNTQHSQSQTNSASPAQNTQHT